MIKTLFIALLLMAFTAAPCQEPGSAPQLSLSVPSDTFKTGTEVSVQVKLTNNSQFEVNCSGAYVNGIDMTYKWEVKDSSGNPVSKKSRQHSGPSAVGNIYVCTLKPGESIVHETTISSLFDLSRPGKYVIQAGRAFSLKGKELNVRSNKLTIALIR